MSLDAFSVLFSVLPHSGNFNISAFYFFLKICTSLVSLISLAWAQWDYYSHGYCHRLHGYGRWSRVCSVSLSFTRGSTHTFSVPLGWRMARGQGSKSPPEEKHTAFGDDFWKPFHPNYALSPENCKLKYISANKQDWWRSVEKQALGSSLVVQWLGLGTFTVVAWVQSLVRELRSCKPCGSAKKQTKKPPSTLMALLFQSVPLGQAGVVLTRPGWVGKRGQPRTGAARAEVSSPGLALESSSDHLLAHLPSPTPSPV